MKFRLYCSKHSFIATLLVLVAVLFLDAQASVPGIDLSQYDSWLDRADRTYSRDEWEACAREGEEAVLAQWERNVLLLLESGASRDELKNEIDALRRNVREDIAIMTTERLVVWLAGQFIREAADVDSGEYLSYMRKTRNAAIFVTENGKIKRDSQGSPVQTELDGEDAFEEELSAWRQSAGSYFEDQLALWKGSAETAFTELLSDLDGEARELLSSKQGMLFYEMEQNQRRQSDLLLMLEQSEYRYFRLRDQYSLRLESEEESAASRTDAIIEKTRSSIQGGLDRLSNGLDAVEGDVVYDGELTDGDAWREQFLEQLNEGLALWNEAEEDFFVQRVEWERQAGNDLVKGMESWQKAYNTIQEEQHAWLGGMDELRKKGEAMFKREYADLEEARLKALAELEASIEANQGSLAERVENVVENLNRSLEMMNTARTSIDYWLSSIEDGKEYDIATISWDSEEMVESFLEKMASDVLDNLTGTVGGFWGLLPFGNPDYERKVTNWMNVGLRKKIQEEFGSMRKSGSLEKFLAKKQSENYVRTFEEWGALIAAYVTNGMASKIENWYDELFSDAIIDDLFTVDEMEKLFGFDEPIQPQKNDFIEYQQGADAAYNAALEEYTETDYPKYLADLENARSLSLSVFFTGHDNLTIETFGDMSSLKMTIVSQRVAQITELAGKSVSRDEYDQALYWLNDIYIPYEKASKAHNKDLLETYGIIVFEDESELTDGYANNTKIQDPIEALDAYGWESVCLDDYQLELLKARAVEAYWEKEVEVAEAVYAYALDETSSRDTEAETLEKSESALAAYNETLAEYRDAVALLEDVNGALDGKLEEIAAVREQIAEKQSELAKAKQDYANLLVMAELDNADFYIGQFRSYYTQLLDERGLLEDSSWSYDDLAQSAGEYFFLEMKAEASAVLAEVVDGDMLKNPPVLSLGQLGKIAGLRETYEIPDDFTTAVNDDIQTYLADKLGLATGDYWYSILADAYRKGPAGDLDALFRTARDELLSEVNGEIERRLLLVRVLLCEDSSDVYDEIAAFAGENDESDEPYTSIDEALSALDTATALAERSLLSERLDYELPIIRIIKESVEQYCLANEGISDPVPFTVDEMFAGDAQKKYLANLLIRRLGGTEKMDLLSSSVTALYTTLANLSETLGTLEEGSLSDFADELHTIADKDGVISTYLDGGTYFSNGSADFVRTSLASSGLQKKFAGASLLLSGYVADIASCADERRTDALATFGAWLEENGLGSYDENLISFTDPETLWNSGLAITNFKGALRYLSDLETNGREVLMAHQMPEAVQDLFERWLDSVGDIVMAKASNVLGGTEISKDMVAAYLDAYESAKEKAVVLSDLINVFTNTSNTTANRSAVLLALSETGNEDFTTWRETAKEMLARDFASYCVYSGKECTESSFDLWVDTIENASDSVIQAKAELLTLAAGVISHGRKTVAGELDAYQEEYAIRTKIVFGDLTDEEDSSLSQELKEFRDTVHAADGYIEALDGDFISWLTDNNGGASTDRLFVARALMWAQSGVLPDPYFLSSCVVMKEYLSQSCAADSLLLNAICSLSTNEFAGAMKAVSLNQLAASRDYRNARRYNEIAAEAKTCFRQYLGSNDEGTLLYDKDDGDTWESIAESCDYRKSEKTSTVCAENEGSAFYSDDGTVNVALEYASIFNQYSDAFENVINAWQAPDQGTVAAFLQEHNDLFAMTRTTLVADNESETLTVSVTEADRSDYQKSLGSFLAHMGKQAGLAEEAGNIARSIKKFLDERNKETSELTKESYAKITSLEKDITDLQVSWATLIGKVGEDGPVPDPEDYSDATYADLERAYEARYGEARALFEALENAKQDYKTARAVYEYASTPYLGVDSVDTNSEDDDLVTVVENVDPDTRLAEAKEKHLRAEAALDAIESLYENKTLKTLYSNDPAYRKLRDEYKAQYRIVLAVKQAAVLLEQQTQTVLAELEDAKQVYEDALDSIQNKIPSASEDEALGADDVKAYLVEGTGEGHKHIDGTMENMGTPAKGLFAGLSIENGKITWNDTDETEADDAVYQQLASYLNVPLGEHSEFEKALESWLEDLNESESIEKLQAWSNALSWEIFDRAGGMTYDQYIAAWPNIQDEETESDVSEETAPAVPGYLMEYFWKQHVRDKIWENLLSPYTGEEKSGDVWKALKSVCGYGRKYRISETGLIDTIYKAYDKVKGSDEYAFFKFIALSGVLTADKGKNSTILTTSQFSKTYLYALEDYCQGMGVNHALDAPMWHERRDMSEENGRGAELDFEYASNGITNDASALTKAKIDLADKQTAYNKIAGPETGGTVGMDELVHALIYADERASGLVLKDIFKTAGVAYDKSTVSASLKTILSPDGANNSLTDDNTLSLLSTVLKKLQGNFADTTSELAVYLNANGAEPGIAVKQNQNRLTYEVAVRKYVSSGMLPDSTVTRSDVAAWEVMLQDNESAERTKTMLKTVKEYLAETDGEESDAHAVRNLAKALDCYDSFMELKNAEQSDNNAVRQNELVAGVREAFAALVASYRIGIEYLDSFEAALKKPVYSARENALIECELYRSILIDVKDQDSGFGAYIISDVTGALSQSYTNLNAIRMNALTGVRTNEWDLQLMELKNRKASFDNKMDAILSRGMIEWRNAARRIESELASWQSLYQESFTAKTAAWDNQYITFLEKKEAWVDAICEQAVRAGNNEILRNMGAMTEDAIADASTFIITDVIELPDTDCLLASIVDRDLLSGLLSSARILNEGIGDFAPVVFQTLKRDSYNSADTLDKVRAFQTEENEEIAARLAFIQYDQAVNTLVDAKKGLEDSIEEANTATWDGFYDMFARDGFKESGGNFIKNTTVGATLTDTLKEKHVIEGYNYYSTNVRDFTKDIRTPESIDLEAIGATGIQALLDQAMGAVDDESKRIFGDEDEIVYVKDSFRKETYNEEKTLFGEGTGIFVEKTRKIPQTDTITEDTYDEYLDALINLSDEKRSKEAQKHRYRKVQTGAFNEHVGYAPVFKDDADPDRSMKNYEKNVRFAGAGETGRIMGMYIQHKMIEGTGRAEANMPVYSRRLWDDRGSFMAAPTIRSLTDIAVTVAAGVVAPGAGNLLINTALNMIDDAIFTMMDIGNGMDPLDAMESLGKKAATSYVSGRIGGAFSSDGGLLNSTMLGNDFLGKALTKGLELTMGNVATSAINSFSLRGLVEGGDIFDEDAFMEGSFGTNAMAGVVAGMVGHGVTEGLNSQISDSSLFGFSSKYANGVRNFTGTLGNLASTGVTYAMTGNANVNLINTSMFGLTDINDGAVSIGLFEFGFGKDGLHSQIGMGGTDLNLGKLASSLNGVSALYQNKKINEYTQTHKDIEANVAMRALFSYGDKNGRDTYEDILSGKTTLAVNDKLEDNATAKTVMNSDGTKTIFLRSLSNNVTEGVAAGIVLQHEAYRDGVDSADQSTETHAAVTGHTEMAIRVRDDGMYVNAIRNNENLAKDIENYEAGSEAFSAYAKQYDSSGDYWKLMKDGTLVDDGRSSLYHETENGDEFMIWDMEGLGKEESLARILNGKDISEQDIKNAQSVIETMKQYGTDALIPQVVSEEVQKRLGLYAIVKAETSLSEEAFGRVAENSYKINDRLGYFVDLSVVEEDLLNNHYGIARIGKPENIMDPMDRYNFNGAGANTLINGYGTIFNLGTSFEYQGAWGPGNTTPDIRSENFQSIDELAYTQQNMTDTHNKSLRATGRPAITLDRNGNTNFVKTYSNTMNFNNAPSVGSVAGGLSLVAQYSMGVQNAMENATNIQMPTWSINGMNFFTVVGQSFRSLEWSNGSTKIVTGPDFYSANDMMFDRRVRNYANFLDNDEPFWEGIKGGFTGWNF